MSFIHEKNPYLCKVYRVISNILSLELNTAFTELYLSLSISIYLYITLNIYSQSDVSFACTQRMQSCIMQKVKSYFIIAELNPSFT